MKNLLLLTILICSNLLYSKENITTVEKEGEFLDFSSIKDVIENDKLSKSVKVKKTNIKAAKTKRISKKRKKYLIPGENDFWSFFSEYWLVKNAQSLKWDFKKPDYGVEQTFETLLEKLGFYEKKFKILFLNTPNVAHFALPSGPGQYLFILSVPFIKQLDLSKLEIALLLFEDFIRSNQNLFKNFVKDSRLDKILGQDFLNRRLDTKIFNDILQKYDELVFKKGFNFQQQYETTKEIGNMLHSDLKLWQTYDNLLVKIDGLVKVNLLYKYYNNIYPSPELQRGWLNPGSK